MRKIIYVLKVVSILVFISCEKNEDVLEEETEAINFPVNISFKNVGEETLEVWKGGSLISEDLAMFDTYFDEENCLTFFEEETDAFCQSTVITFNDENLLKLEFGPNEVDNLPYQFVNDTLRVTIGNTLADIGVGDIKSLKIYGSLNRFRIVSDSGTSSQGGCGGDEFHKYNFDGQFFLNSDENNSISIDSPAEMNAEDEVVFYNKSYILE